MFGFMRWNLKNKGFNIFIIRFFGYNCHTILIVTLRKKKEKKKNDKCLNKLSTPYLISDESIELLREGVSWFFNIT